MGISGRNIPITPSTTKMVPNVIRMYFRMSVMAVFGKYSNLSDASGTVTAARLNFETRPSRNRIY